jgi:hypothetical protein
MDDVLKTCECGKQFTEAQSSGKHCFGCKTRSIGFAWVSGGGYGRSVFNRATIGEAIRQSDADAAKCKNPTERIGTRWV